MMARILVVDDHPHIVRLLQRELEADGHEVVPALTGEAALLEMTRERPALVVLDVMLPGQDGFQVLRSMRSDPATRAVPVIILSARSAAGDMTHGLELGADWYATKPFRAGDIALLVRRFLADSTGHWSLSARQPPALPPIGELDRLTMTLADALHLAARGRLAEGHACLLAGLQRAEQAAIAREPWAADLVWRYQELLSEYLDRFGEAETEPSALVARGSR
jgi:DNA-binding response OmpR family regulator